MDKILAPIKGRIEKFIENKKITKKDFFEKSEISSSNFKGEGRKSELGGDKIAKILSSFPDINPDWLLTGKGEMLRENSTEVVPVKNYERKGCPYYNVDFSANFALLAEDSTINADYFIDFEPFNKPGAMWCNVSGHSMEPEINNGDIILIKEVNNWQEYLDFDDIYGIVTSNGFRTIKRLGKGRAKDSYTLIPTNPNYESQQLKKSLILRIFKVLCAFKRF